MKKAKDERTASKSSKAGKRKAREKSTKTKDLQLTKAARKKIPDLKNNLNKSLKNSKKFEIYTDIPLNELGTSCDQCGKTFSSIHQRNRHLGSAHRPRLKSKPETCKLCNKTFRDRGKYNRHCLIHSGVKEYQCSICSRLFSRKDHLQKHETVHAPETRIHKCPLCDKRFVENNILQRHLNTHSGNRPWKCKICGAGFFSDNTLNQHVQSHSKARPFLCSLCGKKFKRKGTLKNHYITHTQERPHVCEICQKGFNTKSTLTTHIRIHTGEMPYRCSKCGEGFSRHDTFKYHINRKTDCRINFKMKMIKKKHRQEVKKIKMELMEEENNTEQNTDPMNEAIEFPLQDLQTILKHENENGDM